MKEVSILVRDNTIDLSVLSSITVPLQVLGVLVFPLNTDIIPVSATISVSLKSLSKYFK